MSNDYGDRRCSELLNGQATCVVDQLGRLHSLRGGTARELGMRRKETYKFAVPADPSWYYYAGQSQGSSLRLNVSPIFDSFHAFTWTCSSAQLDFIYIPARKTTRAPP